MQLIDLTPVALSIIALIAGIVSVKVVPVINEKLSKEQRENLYGWAKIAVKASEQLCKTGKIDKNEKKNQALSFLQKKGFNISLDEVDQAIEAAVNELFNS